MILEEKEEGKRQIAPLRKLVLTRDMVQRHSGGIAYKSAPLEISHYA